MLVLAASACLAAVAMLVLDVGGVALVRQHARAAADQAALAAATMGDCAAAARLAAANGAELRDCRLEGSDVQVTVALPLPTALARLSAEPVQATARAGPPS